MPVIHLEADLHETIAWAKKHERRWAFTNQNARAYNAGFYNDVASLGQIKWASVGDRQWSGTGIDPSVKEQKQSEFLVFQSFPWYLVRHIGVFDEAAMNQVKSHLRKSHHRPMVTIERGWYY